MYTAMPSAVLRQVESWREEKAGVEGANARRREEMARMSALPDAAELRAADAAADTSPLCRRRVAAMAPYSYAVVGMCHINRLA